MAIEPAEPIPPSHLQDAPQDEMERRSAFKQLLRFLPDVGRLMLSLATDPDVPWFAKGAAIGALLYVISPIDVLPDALPFIGQLDDYWLVARAFRFLFQEAGYARIRRHWKGSDEGFALLLIVAGVES